MYFTSNCSFSLVVQWFLTSHDWNNQFPCVYFCISPAEWYFELMQKSTECFTIQHVRELELKLVIRLKFAQWHSRTWKSFWTFLNRKKSMGRTFVMANWNEFWVYPRNNEMRAGTCSPPLVLVAIQKHPNVAPNVAPKSHPEQCSNSWDVPPYSDRVTLNIMN